MTEIRERRHEEKMATYEARKAEALATGTRVLYLTCPLCGLNRPLDTYKGRADFEVKPDFAIIQVRYGGGRGRGFFLSEDESVNLEGLKEEFPEVFDNLKEEIEKLYEIFKTL